MIAPELEAALTSPEAVRRLDTAVRRAEQHLNRMLDETGCRLPSPAQRTLHLPARGDIPVDPGQVMRMTTAQLASVLHAALLESVSTDPALEAPDDPQAAPRPDAADRAAADAGAELHVIAQDEMVVSYRPHRNMSAEEAVAVEDRLMAALSNTSGGSVLEESGGQWVVRVP